MLVINSTFVVVAVVRPDVDRAAGADKVHVHVGLVAVPGQIDADGGLFRGGRNDFTRELNLNLTLTLVSGVADHEAPVLIAGQPGRSEERRVGKECRSRWSQYH